MKLLIISNMAHYYCDGRIVGWGPTVLEINALSSMFSEIVHLGSLYDMEAPGSSIPYLADRVQFVPLTPSGGNRVIDKIGILKHLPVYLQVIIKWLPWADVIHLRSPANIPMLALLFLPIVKTSKIRWVKYAGNWNPAGGEPLSYKFQRWFLRNNFHRGVVTVNGKWPDQPAHITSFRNPSLELEMIEAFSQEIRRKKIGRPIRILFVGRVEAAKGIDRILQIADFLLEWNILVTIEIVGDGKRREYYQRAAEIRFKERNPLIFHGWLPHSQVMEHMKEAHIFLLPSKSEGWPKVLSEAMAFGAVPVASNVGSIPQIFDQVGNPHYYPFDDVEAFAAAIKELTENPDTWKRIQAEGHQFSKQFTFESYLTNVRELLGI